MIEAVGVIASVDWMSIPGVAAAAILPRGNLHGLAALGLTSARTLAEGQSQPVIGLMTASFGIGQMVGPYVAGHLAESTGSLRAPSWLAAGALFLAAILAAWPPLRKP